jgi:hypothetical protein
MAVFDDGSGSGPGLYMGGQFTLAGGMHANGVARWDGQGWSTLASGVDDPVRALTVFDDGSGSGPALYVGGDFATAGGQVASRIARWDGQSWSALSSGMNGPVHALAVFDDGSGAGPALYAGGDFTMAGGQAANRIARWDGIGWSAVSSGTSAAVYALTVFDDGSGAGPALYAGGKFSTAGGQSAMRLAKWDGQSWSAVGGGIASGDGVWAFAVFDDGSGAGPALYAGGDFHSAGGTSAESIARWDGQAWSALGSGLDPYPSSLDTPTVQALAVFDDGSGAGPALFAGGQFDAAGGQPLLNLAKWDGQAWSSPVHMFGVDVSALTAYDDGSGAGPALYIGGFISLVEALFGDLSAKHVARWDGQTWSVLGTGLTNPVRALAVLDDGSGGGPALYAGGYFISATGQVDHVTRWDGQSWVPLGIPESGPSDTVHAIAPFDDGSGSGTAIYAGGFGGIFKWDGQTWSKLDDGGMSISVVYALCVFDDGGGAGPALYVGGSRNPGTLMPFVARWDGQSWSELGSGLQRGGVGPAVYDLTVFDDGLGGGPALYAGGRFTTAGGVTVNHVARWNGHWSALGSGMDGDVRALAVFDDGSGAGPALYAGGDFEKAGGQTATRAAKWDGQSWSPLGVGTNDTVTSLTVVDGGSMMPALYAGGQFTTAGGQGIGYIARWDGQGWSPLGSGVGPDGNPSFYEIEELVEFDDGSGAGPALIAGGSFVLSPGDDIYIAKWGCPAIDALPGCFGNPAALTALSQERSIGSTLEVSLSSSDFSTGLGVLYFGLEGVDASGCGLFVPSIGELLLALAPMPQPVGSDSLSAGEVTFALPVPANPSLVGVHIAFQGVTVGLFEPGTPIGMSNALAVTITQ